MNDDRGDEPPADAVAPRHRRQRDSELRRHVLRDLPGREQKDKVWSIYQRRYGLDAKQARPDDAQWTGAEIKSCCRLASLLDVPLVHGAPFFVSVAVTAGDKIEALRHCLRSVPVG